MKTVALAVKKAFSRLQIKDDQCNTGSSIIIYSLLNREAVINNSLILLSLLENKLCKQPTSLGNCLLLAPPPSPRNYRCPPWGGGGGVCGIFSGTTHFLLFTLQGNETANGGANNHLCADNIQIPASTSKTYSCSPKAYGRYLYIRIPGNDKTLTLCEVEVYSLSKSVNLSSCLFCRYA